VDRERRRLILSERAANQESREAMKDRLLTEISIGETRKGRVTSLADFGAFVNINGADGLVHLSELSWERVDHPSKMLKVGDEVEVKVISIDQERKRIGLSMRQLQKDPWDDHVTNYRVGQLVEGTITRLVKFGAFARLDEHIEGLIHISELGEDRIEHPKEAVQEGEKLTLRIIKIEPDKRRIGLSLRKVDSAQYSDLDYEAAMAEVGEMNGSQKHEPEQAVPVMDEVPAEQAAPAAEPAAEAPTSEGSEETAQA
jgi:small subunit ribosomal protein S1